MRKYSLRRVVQLNKMTEFNLILSSTISKVSYSEAVLLITTWARKVESRAVFAANVHMVMEAWDSARLRDELEPFLDESVDLVNVRRMSTSRENTALK